MGGKKNSGKSFLGKAVDTKAQTWLKVVWLEERKNRGAGEICRVTLHRAFQVMVRNIDPMDNRGRS